MLDVIKFIVENIVEILTIASIIVAMIQTWRANRGKFWKKIKETASELIKEAESMEFKPGEGQLKKDFVIDKLLEKFSSKFAFISKEKLEEIVEVIVASFNTFSNLN